MTFIKFAVLVAVFFVAENHFAHGQFYGGFNGGNLPGALVAAELTNNRGINRNNDPLENLLPILLLSSAFNGNGLFGGGCNGGCGGGCNGGCGGGGNGGCGNGYNGGCNCGY